MWHADYRPYPVAVAAAVEGPVAPAASSTDYMRRGRVSVPSACHRLRA